MRKPWNETQIETLKNLFLWTKIKFKWQSLRATLLNVYYGNTPRDIKSVSICD